MSLIGRLFGRDSKDQLGNFIKTATDQELADAYEERRVEWARNGQNGTGIKTPEMKRIDEEMTRRSYEKWQNDPRSKMGTGGRWTDANRWDD